MFCVWGRGTCCQTFRAGSQDDQAGSVTENWRVAALWVSSPSSRLFGLAPYETAAPAASAAMDQAALTTLALVVMLDCVPQNREPQNIFLP